ncbi:MAG: galactose-1-phosphate uridylyltransferase [Acidimicrobiales bacterium]
MASPDVRVDPLTGEAVVVVESRQQRPNLPAAQCPFCPGGLEAPEPYDVRWFPNRWPPLPDGRAEIVLYTPVHDASFPHLGVDGAAKVVALWGARTAALGARSDVDYVLVFENRGAEVGATIAHPHGQIYALDAVPPHPRAELGTQTCAICAEEPDARLVVSAGGWRAWVPHAATWPYGLVIAPLDHLPDLPAVRDPAGAAAVLIDVLGRLDALFGAAMPYMLWWHQRPTDGANWPTAHVHAHVAPLYRAQGTQRFVAAGELGSGVYFNPVRPEDAAAELRSVSAAQ